MTKSSRPYLSIVIPALNEERYIEKCISSFQKQTFKDFELIVSDGGSTDKTAVFAEKLGAKIVVSPNSTVTIARQQGSELARGKIIVGADADNIYPKDHLKMIAEHFSDPCVVAVGGFGEFEKKPYWVYWGWKIANFIFSKIYSLSGFILYVPAFNLSYRRDVFFKMGGYNTYLDFGGDELDILSRLKHQGKVIFDKKLKSFPSSRRAKVGFFKLIIKHTLIDYYLSYLLAKTFRKPIIRGKPVR